VPALILLSVPLLAETPDQALREQPNQWNLHQAIKGRTLSG